MQINPVIEKELKIKMRGWKSPALVTVYLGFLGLVIFMIFLTSDTLSGGYGYFNPRIATDSYSILTTIQLFMLIFIVPAMTGSAISGERERQTLDLLLCTNLSPLSIVTGKIFVSISHIMLLITASLPILGTVFLFGGIGFTDLLILFGFYIATAIMLASIGIFYSTIFKRSAVSQIVTYITVLFIIFGTTIIYGVWSAFSYSSYNTTLDYNNILSIMFSNPLFGFGSIMEGINGNGSNFFDIFGLFVGRRTNTATQGVIKPWMANVIFDAAAFVIFSLLSARRIQPVKKSRRRRKQV